MKNKKNGEKIIQKLAEKYGDIDAFIFYNKEFKQYELVMSLKYEQNTKFEDLLNKLLISEIISKNLYLCTYFADDFEEMKENYGKKVYEEKDNKTDILESISPKIKLLFEENEQNTDYLIPLDKNNSVKLVKVQEK